MIMQNNTKRVLDAARDFKIGSDILRAKFGETIFPLRTTIVTTAFSIELYLKYIALHFGLEIRGHDLNKLFSQLPVDLQKTIRENYSGIGSFSDTLLRNKSLFVDWRYIYEKQDQVFSVNDIPSLISLRDTLEAVAVNLDKES
jgi:hypothetical protein